MGREVRRVPKDWKHPKESNGDYIPLHNRCYETEAAEWDEEYIQWKRGFRRSYGNGDKWKEIEPEYKDMDFSEWTGSRPSPIEYMPDWPENERTHLMMYETCSEGTPISPAFETPEELARWLTDNNASAFGSMTATYKEWLAMCKAGWALSMVYGSGGLKSGVAAMASGEKDD